MKDWARLLAAAVVLLLISVAGATQAAQRAGSRPAVPAEPITAVLDAFKAHQVVALDEGNHGNQQGHAFRLALIRDPRFAATVNDIVVEFGNSRYQDVMDRFVRGEDVSTSALRQVWENTTQPHAVWDRPIYEEFFQAVRGVNATLPRDHQLRVLLGDPPMNWDRVRNHDDLLGEFKRLETMAAPFHRDAYPADLIRREVVEKKRRALVIYGGMHLPRRPDIFGPFPSMVSLLEGAAKTRVFTIWTHTLGKDLQALQEDVASWRVPSLAVTADTVLGSADFAFYYPFDLAPPPRGGEPPRRAARMDEEFDAVLYLGPVSAITLAPLSPTRCADVAFMDMRLARMALVPGSEGRINGLKAYCAAQTQK
jgi:hypothetical protein